VLHRLVVGALLAAKSFDEPHKSLIGGGDDLAEATGNSWELGLD
jgi:hypothetical protein